MNKILLKEIDKIRSGGFRPQIVGCFLNDKKILFLFKREHNLWQLPQGGIDNKETIGQAVIREMAEEMGSKFLDSCDKVFTMIGDDQIEFPPSTQNSRDLKTDKGKNIFMKGKKYFFIAINKINLHINIDDTEFNDYKWLLYNQAIELANQIHQRGKKRITINALNLLKKSELI